MIKLCLVFHIACVYMVKDLGHVQWCSMLHPKTIVEALL